MSGKLQRGLSQELSQELLKENRNFVPETVPDAVFLLSRKLRKSAKIVYNRLEIKNGIAKR